MKVTARHSYLGVVAVAAVVRGIFIYWSPFGGGDWDIYSVVAENILRGCGVSLSEPSGLECIPHFGGNHLPGYPVFVAAVWALSGHSDMAVRCAQLLLYAIALFYLMKAVLEYTQSELAGALIGLVMALSPLQVAWPRYTQTETLALATGMWVFAEIILSLAERRLRAVPIAFGVVAATFIRLDGILLTIPVAVLAFILHPPLKAIRAGLPAAIIVAIPLAAWTARNIIVGLPSWLPAPMVMAHGHRPPLGYLAWGATWISEEYQRPGWGFPINRLQFREVKIDDAAFDSREERELVHAWLAELAEHNGREFPSEIDARFAELARERASRHPIRTFVWLPVVRALGMWKNPFSSFGWPNELPSSVGHQQRLDSSRSVQGLLDLARAFPVQAASKAYTAAYRITLLAVFLVLLAYSFHRRFSGCREIVWIVFAWVSARTVFFAFTNNVETRYAAPVTPALELAVVLGLLVWRNWIHLSDRSAAAR